MLLREVTVENFRGIEKVTVALRRTTVLIGENNCGKTSFIEAIRLALDRAVARKGNPFDDYDHHLAAKGAQPSDSGLLTVTLTFAESKPDEWSEKVAQTLGDVIVVADGDLRQVKLRVTSVYDQAAGDFVTDWEFLNAADRPLPPKSKRPALLYSLIQLAPVFYLSAVRDAAREFQPRSQFWGRFLRNPSMPAHVREQLEKELAALNTKILDAEPRLREVQDTLAKAQEVVALSDTDTVTIEALPARIWDIFTRAQIIVGSPTGANIPLGRHGSGTQSLSVIYLFEAFLAMMLAQTYGEDSEAILAVEEPEAHLHPCAIRSLWRTLDGLSGQKIIASHSGDLLAEAPLSAVRRFHRVGGRIEVRQVRKGTLTPDDARKLHFHLQKTRGELLFARCWLLGEGATEYWVFSETARILGIDLERLGIRIVTYRQVEAEPFVKVADDLGICWHCVVDGDSSGQRTRKTLLSHLDGRDEADLLTVLPADNVELLLCEHGFGHVYHAQMADQKKHLLTAKPGQPNYWKQVLDCLPNRFCKEQAAIDVMVEMKRKGKSAVPPALAEIVTRAAALAQA